MASDEAAAHTETPETSWFRRVTFYSMLSALAPLIPVPYLDDRVLASVRQRMVGGMLRHRGVAAEPAAMRALSEGADQPVGCLRRAALLVWMLTIKLVGRLIRKLVIFLTFKESADQASKSFHLGYLLHRALESEALAPAGEAVSQPRALAFHAAVEEVLKTVDHRPIEQLFKRSFVGSRSLLRHAARALRRRGVAGAASDDSVRDQSERLGSAVDRLSADLEAQRGYFERLDAELAARLPSLAGHHPS
jgi:hypothetical protein